MSITSLDSRLYALLLRMFPGDVVHDVVESYLSDIAQGVPPPGDVRAHLVSRCTYRKRDLYREEKGSRERRPLLKPGPQHDSPLDRAVAREAIRDLPRELVEEELQGGEYDTRTLRRRRLEARRKFNA